MMRAVSPNTGAPETVLDPDGRALPAALYRDSALEEVLIVLTRWELDDDERDAIARGEDLYVVSLTKTDELQTFQPTVGPGPYLVEPTCDANDYSSERVVPTDSEGAE